MPLTCYNNYYTYVGRFHASTQIVHHRRLYRLSIENTLKIVFIACSKHAKYRQTTYEGHWILLLFFVTLFFYVIDLIDVMRFVSHADIITIGEHKWDANASLTTVHQVDWISGNAWPYNRIVRKFRMTYREWMAYPQAIISYNEQRAVPSRLINWFKCIWIHSY